MFKPGLYTALVTPFNQQGRCDIPAFNTLLEQQIAAEVAGVVLFGSTGESPTITFEERETLLSLAMKKATPKTHIMAGISTNDLQTAITLAKQAERHQVGGLQIASPAYNKPSQEGLYQFYKAIGESVDLPIFLYNIPGRSCVHLEKNTIKRLFSLPFIRGIKEASGSMPMLFDVLDLAKQSGKDLLVLEGDDALALPGMSCGAHGVMSVLSNLIPKTMKTYIDLILNGELEKARALFFQIKPLMEACFLETNPTPIKQLLHMKGLLPTPCVRLPLVEPTESTKASLRSHFTPFYSWS